MTVRFADAVIVAAGSSSRMGGRDKLAESLLGRPLLAWSVDAMARAETVDRIVVVTRADNVAALQRAAWLEGATVVAGGAHRSDSVRVGVEAAGADVVLVHDGARPLASSALADAVARVTAEHGAAVPAVAVADSLKKTRDRGGWLAESVDRESIVRTQTPQGAQRDLLLAAFARTAGRSFTDEAALLEAAGVPVATVPGEAANIKVTDQGDLEMARALASGAAEQRIGFGEDSHPFGPGEGLMLGGIAIEGAPQLYGHSDGDVVLHALATAILSAGGLGDVGRLYPADDKETTGIASQELVQGAVKTAAKAGWRPSRAHVSIVGSRPRLGAARLEKMSAVIAQVIGCDADSVSVAASTGNLSGPEGEGRAIRATALVTVIRR